MGITHESTLEDTVQTEDDSKYKPSLDLLVFMTQAQGGVLCQVLETFAAIEKSIYGEVTTKELLDSLDGALYETPDKFPGKIAMLKTQVEANKRTTLAVLRGLESLMDKTVGRL